MNRSSYYSQILAAYLKGFSFMNKKYVNHFCIRMYRITGNRKYLTFIRTNIASIIPSRINFLGQLHNLSKKSISHKEDVRKTIRRNPLENKRILRRENFYKINYKLKYYFSAISTLHNFWELKLHSSSYGSELKKIYKKFRDYHWSQELLKEKYLSINPVYFVNSIYYLKNLKIADYMPVLEKFVQKKFPSDRLLKEELLIDQIYIYTHILINESKFYQQHLSKKQIKKFEWIYDFFQKNFSFFYKKVNLDLILEVLICFQMAKKENTTMENLAMSYLEKFYDTKKGYLLADRKATLEDMEHANILFLIYLKSPSKFYRLQKP